MTRNMVKVECPKCLAKRTIEGFGHIANGVCFCCRGTGFIIADNSGKNSKASPETIKKARWIVNATAAQFDVLTMEQLEAARAFSHHPVDGFPHLYDCWIANGEAAFQAKQAVAREAFMRSWTW